MFGRTLLNVLWAYPEWPGVSFPKCQNVKMSKCLNLFKMMYGRIQAAVGEGCKFLEFPFCTTRKI